MATKKAKDNTVTIKLDTGGEQENASQGGVRQGQQVQQPVQPQVKADPLGYAEQREAAATAPAYAIPNNLQGMDLRNPVAPSSHPQVDLMNPKPAENAAVAASKEALGRQITTPLQEEKSAFDKGYEEQEDLDAISMLLKERQEGLAAEQERLNAAEEQDEMAQRNERSRKVIAGLGDAISSIVNLVGTTQGAYDQKQVFMEPRLRDTIEQDRQRRYAKMERQRANVQSQINAINNLKLAGEKIESAERQNAANLAYKAAKDAADRAQKQGEYDRKWQLDNWKAQNAADYNEQRLQLQRENNESMDRARRTSSWNQTRNTTSMINKRESAGTGGGSGRGSGKWYDTNNFQEFQDEIARSLNIEGKRYSSWDELVSDRNAMRDPKVRSMLSELSQANTSDKQRAAVQKYIDHAPTWKGKYWGQGVAEYEEPEEDAAPWLAAEEEDKDKAPWL